jgi:ABC-2 type transport system ATP-binding protein
MSPMIAIRNARKQFATVCAVDDVSFEVRPKEIFALLGPNGAGKTTLLRMLLGLIRPDSGRIEFLGDGGRPPEPRETGYLPEDRGLYPDVRVLDTLTYFGTLRGMARRAAHAAAESWLQRMDLGDRGREPLKSLSKGNQQKIQFISAVLHAPTFVVLDEPFSGLDPLNQDLFLSLIHELRERGATVILSAHQMQLVERVADTILVLNRGRVVLHGSLADIRRRWTTGRRLLVRAAAPVPDDFPAQSPGVEIHSTQPGEIELFVPEGVRLGPLLGEIGARLDVRDIESHPITLHDVYVRAIAQHNAGTPALEAR